MGSRLSFVASPNATARIDRVRPVRSVARRRRAMTLVEMLVAMTVTLIMVLALVQMLELISFIHSTDHHIVIRYVFQMSQTQTSYI